MIDVDPLQAINHYNAGFVRHFCDDPLSGLPYMARGFELGPALPSGINIFVRRLWHSAGQDANHQRNS